MDAALLADGLVSASERFSTLLDSVDDPSRPAVGVWSIADTAVHMAFVLEHLPRYLLGAEELPGRAEEFEQLADAHTAINDEVVRSATQRDLSALSKQVMAGARELVATAGNVDPEARYPWFGGVTIPPTTYLAIAVNDLLIHGFDIARATGRKWPVDRPTVASVLSALLPMTPYYTDHAAAVGFDACFELRVRGGATSYVTYDNGVVSVSDKPPRRVDCHISADPWWYLLVGYGRVGQVRAVLRGKIATWGRRPLLALKLAKLSATP